MTKTTHPEWTYIKKRGNSTIWKHNISSVKVHINTKYKLEEGKSQPYYQAKINKEFPFTDIVWITKWGCLDALHRLYEYEKSNWFSQKIKDIFNTLPAKHDKRYFI